MNSGSCQTGNVGALLDLEDVRAVLKSAAELRGVDGEAKAGVDSGVDNGVLNCECGVR